MITSTSNAKVKRLVNLKKKKKLRDEEGVFLVEGIRMFREVPKDRLVEVYASEEFWHRERKAVEQVLAGTKVQPEILADFVFEYVSDTKTPQGILCLVRQKQYSITEIVKEKGGELPLLLVLDQIQDPGNLGTIVRTAEGAGVTGIVMSQDCVDMYNPKVVRSTMGAAYRVPFCYVDDLAEEVKQMKEAGIQVILKDEVNEHFALIDDELVWHGGMNLLGKEDVWDNLMRIRSAAVAEELLELALGKS